MKIFEIYAATTGLDEVKAENVGFEAVSATITHRDKADYYGSKPIHVKIILDKGTGRILGGQLVGGESAGVRINIFVAAITAGMTVYEFNQLDLAYAPSVAPVYDPVLIAASAGIKAIRKK